jgi:hypothetical protein
MSYFMKISPVGAELFHAERRKDGRTEITEVIVAFRHFANAPKKADENPRSLCEGP